MKRVLVIATMVAAFFAPNASAYIDFGPGGEGGNPYPCGPQFEDYSYDQWAIGDDGHWYVLHWTCSLDGYGWDWKLSSWQVD